jgi:hypothetical protein
MAISYGARSRTVETPQTINDIIRYEHALIDEIYEEVEQSGEKNPLQIMRQPKYSDLFQRNVTEAEVLDEIYNRRMKSLECENKRLNSSNKRIILDGSEIIKQELAAQRIADTIGKNIEDIFYRLPFCLVPYSTPSRLRVSGITKYSEGRIRQLVNNGDIPEADHIERQIIVFAGGVQRILDRENQQTGDDPIHTGNAPGVRFPDKKPRHSKPR